MKCVNSILISIIIVFFYWRHIRGSYDIVFEVLNAKIKLSRKKRLRTLWILMIIFFYSVTDVTLVFIENLIKS